MIKAHFINVGQGNMVAVVFPDNEVLVYDCNITDDNEVAVLAYLKQIMPNQSIDVFINSHRDADHTCGIKKLNTAFPIGTLWEAGVAGNTDTPEYRAYMEFRRAVPHTYEVTSGDVWLRKPHVKILNGKRDALSDINAQSIVLRVDHEGSVLLLTGDTNASVWRDHILSEHSGSVNSLVLGGSHHGSFSFFNDDCDREDPFVGHMNLIRPAITILSVGDNLHGHPDDDAIRHYETYCHGTTETKQKIFRTDRHGNMTVELHGGGTGRIIWSRT